MQKISISHVSNLHNDWARSLDFYKNEIGILRGRLNEIASKNTSEEVSKQVEHFENAFRVQNDNIDRLNHDIRLNVTAIGKEAKNSSAGYIDSILLTQHNNLHEKYGSEEKVVNELRHSFNKFAAEWM